MNRTSLTKVLLICILIIGSLIISEKEALACYVFTVKAEPQYIPADGNSTSDIIATIVSYYGEISEGTVEFCITYSDPWPPVGSLSPESDEIDSKGEARTTYTSSTTPAILGIQAKATFLDEWGYQYVLYEYVEVYAVKVEIKSVEFTSDHGVLNDNNSDWTDSGETYTEPEWVKSSSTNNPITQTKNTALTTNITLKVEPSGIAYDLIGDGPNNYFDFIKEDNTSTAQDQPLTGISASAALPDNVDTLSENISWKVRCTAPDPDIDIPSEDTTSHKIYVTYGTPTGSVVTEKRMGWDCDRADGASISSTLADTIWNAVAAETTFGSGDTDGWALLGGGSGDCDNQARLMSYAVKLLGVTPADVRFVRASTNAGAGNCLNLESRVVDSQTHYLIMDFNTGTGYNWNAYEGCCETAEAYYAITPKKKANNDYEMLNSISCQQYWVRTNVSPGSSGWVVLEIFEEVSKP